MTPQENGSLPASLMTKREEIAAKILAGLCANAPAWEAYTLPNLARVAVEQTDALIVALSEGNKP
jgi:hypothetical protein